VTMTMVTAFAERSGRPPAAAKGRPIRRSEATKARGWLGAFVDRAQTHDAARASARLCAHPPPTATTTQLMPALFPAATLARIVRAVSFCRITRAVGEIFVGDATRQHRFIQGER